jgi:cyclohexanone monooxygenase
MSPEEKLRRQKNGNMEARMKIHERIDRIVKDRATAEALKPWYMLMCKRPCFHSEYLPTLIGPTSIWWTPTAKASTK